MEKWQIYLQEARTQINFAKRSYEEFRKAETDNVIVDVFFHLHHFTIHATNLEKLFDAKPGTVRHNILSEHIDLSDLELNQSRRLRNHLEHFDERLDSWVKEYEGHPLFDMNIVTGSKGFPEKAFLRALDGEIFKFHGESYNLTELYTVILEVERRLTHPSRSC